MIYPFSALVGQPRLKQALLLCAVNPGIGGVLIRGDKGTAKSTAVRGLSAVMPPILRVAGSPFNCLPNEPLNECEACRQPNWQTEEVVVPFVNLPLGATEDRVLGSLDLEGILVDRKKKLQPGLLASAHQGVLYIDEVNLLADHLIDSLLDVAAMGINTVQRDGLSVSHPARFTLIGTMNPEEGNLRPQFLDRFGLVVDVAAPRNVTERTEVVRRRIAFETDPVMFTDQWLVAQNNIARQIQQARQLLPEVRMADGLLTFISQLCTQLNVVSLRADIVLYKTALTLAALAGRIDVTADDIRQAADLALPHRQRKKQAEENQQPESKLEELQPPSDAPHQPQPKRNNDQSETAPQFPSENSPQSEESSREESQQEQIFGVLPVMNPPSLVTEIPISQQPAPTGRRNSVMHAPRGSFVRAVPNQRPTDLAVSATVQSAVLRGDNDWTITRDDLHQSVRVGKTGNLILFVVDASGSMAANRRMEAVKGSVVSLLTEAYQHRDSVGVIAFRGVEAHLLLPPTRDIEQAEQALQHLPTGGRTPLPHALQVTTELVQSHEKSNTLRPFVVMLSDGKANVPLPGGGDAWQQTIRLANQLHDQSVAALVIDTDTDYLRLGRAQALAQALGAECVALDELTAETITETVSSRINLRETNA